MSDLKIDAAVHGLPHEVASLAEVAEEQSFDGLWSHETCHDSFLPLPVIADHSLTLELGTRIATAFTRSPMILAQQAWDLQAFSGGRFTLGLGTQVRAHNQRRFSVDFEWEPPGPRLREVVESIRHIWDVFQGRVDNLDYQGEYYHFSLISEPFDPGPIDNPNIPIHIAAVNEYNIRLAGELCDGICLHSFNSPSYTREVVIPLLVEGAERAGRSVEAVTVSASPFVITGRDTDAIERCRERIRERVAFYASTPAYKDVMAHHGWVEIGRTLHELSRDGRWDEMTSHITDEMLSTFAVEAPIDEAASAIRRTYGDIADRVLIAPQYDGGSRWEMIVEGFHT